MPKQVKHPDLHTLLITFYLDACIIYACYKQSLIACKIMPTYWVKD